MLEGYPKRAKDCQVSTLLAWERYAGYTDWPQKITNKELYQRTGQRDITTEIMQRRWRWPGHVIRKDRDSITWTALRWTLDSGRRKRGRPRKTWRRTIEAEMKTTGKTWKELEKAAMEISGLSLMCHLGVTRIIYYIYSYKVFRYLWQKGKQVEQNLLLTNRKNRKSW